MPHPYQKVKPHRRRYGALKGEALLVFSTLMDKKERGFLDGQFLIAMPGLANSAFERSVIYICAHSQAGAMGFIINRGQQITFTDVLLHLKIMDSNDAIMLPTARATFPSSLVDRWRRAGASCFIPMITPANPVFLSATTSR